MNFRCRYRIIDVTSTPLYRLRCVAFLGRCQLRKGTIELGHNRLLIFVASTINLRVYLTTMLLIGHIYVVCIYVQYYSSNHKAI